MQLQSCGAATGAYLDKAAVTDRVVTVLKNFNKVDAAKVRRVAGRARRAGRALGGSFPFLDLGEEVHVRCDLRVTRRA